MPLPQVLLQSCSCICVQTASIPHALVFLQKTFCDLFVFKLHTVISDRAAWTHLAKDYLFVSLATKCLIILIRIKDRNGSSSTNQRLCIAFCFKCITWSKKQPWVDKMWLMWCQDRLITAIAVISQYSVSIYNSTYITFVHVYSRLVIYYRRHM